MVIVGDIIGILDFASRWQCLDLFKTSTCHSILDDPRMVQYVGSFKAVLRVLLEQLGHEIFSLFGDLAPVRIGILYGTTFDMIKKILLATITFFITIGPTAIPAATSIEGQKSAKHGITNDSQRPEITAFVIGEIFDVIID